MADWFAQRGADLLLEHIEFAVCAGDPRGQKGPVRVGYVAAEGNYLREDYATGGAWVVAQY